MGFSSCDMWAPERTGSVVVVRELSTCGTRAPEHAGFSLVAVHGLSCPVVCGILVPRPGIELPSLGLEGRFLTTGLPGKSPPLPFLPCDVIVKRQPSMWKRDAESVSAMILDFSGSRTVKNKCLFLYHIDYGSFVIAAQIG